MLDFVEICVKDGKRGCPIIYPDYVIDIDTKDLMIRGKAFYAVWDEGAGVWRTNERYVAKLIDQELYRYRDEHPELKDAVVETLLSSETGRWLKWVKFSKTLPDSYQELDKKVLFANDDVKKEDYATIRLPYFIGEQAIPCYNELMDTLYAPKERHKLEWAIGSIIAGDSKKIQKFIVLYGGPGTGKSTVLNIIQDMFDGYCALFEAKSLTSNGDFAMESLKSNPLIAIQHDGDLSRIEDNSRLNSIVSHEQMIVNEKFKSMYTTRFQSFLFMGTNRPVKVTDAKAGILRRLIEVRPTGKKFPLEEYERLMDGIRFEYGGIAQHCLDVYKKAGKNFYGDYVAKSMMGETNYLYGFIEDNYFLFESIDEEGITLKTLWARYKEYCEEALVPYPLSMRVFKYEIMAYFKEFYPRLGRSRRSVYVGFQFDKFEEEGFDIDFQQEAEAKMMDTTPEWLQFYEKSFSEFDLAFNKCPAQYAVGDGKPGIPWDEVTDKLEDLDPRKLHYVRVPINLIVIDFDLKNEDGEKDPEKNLKEAAKFPATYAELSKSQAGIHLHYYYSGDPEELKRIYGEDIEIKVFSGKSSLRRMLTRCNDYPIATISSGLPLKETNNMLTDKILKSEQALRKLIERNLRKEIHPGTKPSIDFIYKILNDAYEQGLTYDITDLRNDVQSFALRSTHNADYCLRMVSKMKFRSEEPSENTEPRGEEIPIVFFDVEVFPNLFVICAKRLGGDKEPMIKMINPKPDDVRNLTEFRLVGFNNRRYDNHILYARMMGYTNEELYHLSKRIIDGDRDAFFGEAYNLSYTDIYDFLSAQNKMSLKKWEIKLGIHHKELDIPWDKSVEERRWEEVADYCGNDVIATEAVWDANQGDFQARLILADWAEMTPNDTTNSLTTRIIVGKDPKPQDKFIYTDLSTIFPGYEYNPYGIDPNKYLEGTKIVRGKSLYMGEDPGEGGYVYAEPGIHYNVALLDITSMHPHSAIALKVFGEEYTKRFEDIVEGRVSIKHKDVEMVKTFLPERLWHYLEDSKMFKALATAIKTAINSVYGLTSASFPNKLKDPRNIDNIVAKYGALFMINLKHEVQKRGFTVAHIKTDSIKIANADPIIIQFVMDYGKKYGYTFEHEDTYSKMCLVNDAVYIAKYKEPHVDEETGKIVKWTATGTQFQVPYVFKTLFSKEKVAFRDLCETKTVSKNALYLDMNESLSDLPFDEFGNATSDYDNHNYRFVGRVGSFCPVKSGKNGGILLRSTDDGKYSAVSNTKIDGKGDSAYRWLEEEDVLKMNLPDPKEIIDMSYWDKQVEEAITTINKYGDFERFVADDDFMQIPDGFPDEVPFEEFPMNQPEMARS